MNRLKQSVWIFLLLIGFFILVKMASNAKIGSYPDGLLIEIASLTPDHPSDEEQKISKSSQPFVIEKGIRNSQERMPSGIKRNSCFFKIKDFFFCGEGIESTFRFYFYGFIVAFSCSYAFLRLSILQSQSHPPTSPFFIF